MSFAVRNDAAGVEWAGSNLPPCSGRRATSLRPAFWGMLSDILRFNRETTALLARRRVCQQGPLGEFLARGRYSATFRDWYLLPMAAAIWSCPTRRDARHAARHVRALLPRTTACCRSSTDRSGAPSRAAAATTCARSPPSSTTSASRTPVAPCAATPGGVRDRSHAGGSEHFDQVVHGLPQRPGAGPSRRMRRGPSSAAALGASATSPTARCCIPTAPAAARRHAWSAWNYLADAATATAAGRAFPT